MLTHRIAFAAMLFAVSACATAATPEQLAAKEEAKAAQVFADDPRRGEEVGKLCFAHQIDSFGETTKRAVVVREGRDYYLVETYPGCFDLDWAQSLAFDSFTSCLSKGDRVFAFDTAFATQRSAGHQQSCRVKAIYEWNKDAEAEDESSDDETEDQAEDETLETASLN